MLNKKLSDMEYRFMQYIWKHPNGVLSQDVYKEFPQALGTKSAVLNHIKAKGYVKMEQTGKQTVYTALISKKEYDKMVMEEKIRRTLGVDSLGALIAALCGKEKLTSKQADELYDLIEKLKEEGDE